MAKKDEVKKTEEEIEEEQEPLDSDDIEEEGENEDEVEDTGEVEEEPLSPS